MVTRLAYPSFPYFGVRADTAETAASLILTALSRCPDVIIQEPESGADITVTAPHRLSHSPILAGAIQASTGRTRAERQAAARDARASVRPNLSLTSAFRAALGAIITKAATTRLISFSDRGLVVHRGRLSPQDRVLMLGGLYSALRPDSAPPLWWIDGTPGQAAILGNIMNTISSMAIAEAYRTQQWLAKAGLDGRLYAPQKQQAGKLGGSLLVGDKAASIFLKLLAESGQVAIAADGQRFTAPGKGLGSGAYLTTAAVDYPGLQRGPHVALFRRLRQQRRAFMLVDGGDLVIDLNRIPDYTEDPSLWPLGEGVRDMANAIVLAELYRLIRTDDQPAVHYQLSSGEILLLWPVPRICPLERVVDLHDRWSALLGQDQMICS